MDKCISEPGTKGVNDSESPVRFPSLWVVGEQKRSGLILCNPYYAEFSGPGAAICSPFEQGYSMIVGIGSPDLVEVTTPAERQKAYSRRIQWVRWLNKIVSHPDAIQRTEKLFAGFEEFFGSDILAAIPDEVMASLTGVFPQTVALVRSQYPRFWAKDRLNFDEDKLHVEVWTSENEMLRATNAQTASIEANSTKALVTFPCSA